MDVFYDDDVDGTAQGGRVDVFVEFAYTGNDFTDELHLGGVVV